ncbi:response regulator transcription factor [Haliangium sp.]|uniref:response regulator transcription factor n=1 Tax=Haliangium sp. TaxID=2663208 RepID=UPI003D147C49
MQRHVLIIEDDEQLGAQLVRHLEEAGLRGRWLKDGRRLDGDDLRQVELVVLDLMLPSMHGFDVLKHLRTLSDVPVLILSARSDTADKIRGLKLGADDYMTKPFWPEEFVERVRARLRRPIMQHPGGVQVGALRIDKERREVFVADELVPLTRVEFDLIAALAERPGAAMTRRALVERVLDADQEGYERTLDVHISRIRKKLGAPALIETVWGIGYRLAADEDA